MRRRLGQHFLTDPAILDRVVDALDPGPADRVLEIGAGRGSLTRRLSRRVGTVVAIEKDRALAAQLLADERQPLAEHVRVVVGDALRLDWHRLMAETGAGGPGGPFKVAGNVPYAITTPLIDKALTPPLPAVVVFLMQREVADRLAALPGSKSYGALTVGVRAAAGVERLFPVKPGSFRPPPAVESAAVRITPAQPLVSPEAQRAFRAFVTRIFSGRRKQMVRVLRSVLGASREEVDALLLRSAVAPTARPETLHPEQFATLFHATRVDG